MTRQLQSVTHILTVLHNVLFHIRKFPAVVNNCQFNLLRLNRHLLRTEVSIYIDSLKKFPYHSLHRLAYISLISSYSVVRLHYMQLISTERLRRSPPLYRLSHYGSMFFKSGTKFLFRGLFRKSGTNDHFIILPYYPYGTKQ
jgi:hypothetical protein